MTNDERRRAMAMGRTPNDVLPNKKLQNWLGLAKRRAINIRPKAVVGGLFGRFSNFDKCRPEEAGDIVSDAAAYYVSIDVSAKFGDSKLNIGRTNPLFNRSHPFSAFFCSI